MRELVIGVDGGGTKTIAWLAPFRDLTTDVVLGRGYAGPGNPRAAGFDAALSNIGQAIEAAFADAKLPPSSVAAACFGLAGAGRVAEQERIAAWAVERGISPNVRVMGDAEPILATISHDNCGVVLICGTGSLAWGRNSAGQTARCGGWGYLMGDEGSGFAIALAALRAATRSADRGEPSLLLELLLQEFGAVAPHELIERVYAPEMTRERLAGLAKIVFEAANTDDTAKHIVWFAAGELADMVATVSRRLQLAPGTYPVGLAGSVLLNQPSMRDLLDKQLRVTGAPAAYLVTVTEPVRGAVALARTIASANASTQY